MTQEIVVLGGLGDAYLVAALFAGFLRHHGRDAILVVKSGHAAIMDLFPGISYRIDDAITFGTEADLGFQRAHRNELWTGKPFFAHPRMAPARLLIDDLPARPFVCQADLFRMVLSLPGSSPLAVSTLPQCDSAQIGSVMIVEANTWPNTQPGFYPKLVAALRAAGRDVWINDKAKPLRSLFAKAMMTEWVIGPQCGLMSIFVTGRFPCRKTLATPSIDGGKAPHYWAPTTFPYAYVNRYAGQDFDVEEFKIEDDHDSLIDAIVNGSNAHRPKAPDPKPTTTVTMPLTPGDFLDRLAVLTVKRERFSADRRAAIEREWRRHAEASGALLANPDVAGLYVALLALHGQTFELLERMVPAAVGGGMMAVEDHVKAVRANKARVELKQAIDVACRAPYSEAKSYYDGDKPR